MGEFANLVESDSATFYDILDETLALLDRGNVKYVLMGGVASAARGGHRFTHDIDVFCKPEDADRVLVLFAKAGFRTEKTYPEWLYKAFKKRVMIDVIFKSSGPVVLDDEMIERATIVRWKGRDVRALSPEDLFVVKALVMSEHTLAMDPRWQRHVYDMLSILRSCEIDWDYLVRRARLGPRRVLGFLLYAQSLDLPVPNGVVRKFIDSLGLS
jgi:hypothetical protein